MSTFNGTLDVTVTDAQLSYPQHLSKQDPYCVVTLGSSGLKNLLEGERLGKEKFQTSVHNGAGQHPIWNESHTLSLKNMTFDSHLKVKIYDKDVLKDDYLGCAKINLDELMRFDNKGVQYFPIYKRGTLKSTAESLGQVGVAVKFNCTEIPQGRGDIKTQAQEAMIRKDQMPMGVHGVQQLPSTHQGTSTGIAPVIGVGSIAATTLAHGTHGTHGITGTGMTGTGMTGMTQPTQMTQTGTAGMTGTGMTGTGMTGTGMTQSNPVTTFNGSIDITISDARLLITQHGSKQDPYCVVALGSTGLKSMMEGQSLGKEKFQTKVHNGAGQHPIWNETHALSLQNMKLDSYLEVRVYDKDLLKDDYLGLARISLGELLPFDKRGVQYLPLYKKGAFHQTKSEQIGQVGVGVVFNCTEMPQYQADMKSQAMDSIVRKEHQLGGVSGPYQTAQSTGVMGSTMQQGHMTGPTTVNQPIYTKPVQTQGTTIPQTQGQFYGH